MGGIVTMQFGDGTFKEIEVDATEEDEALNEARTWVRDNAWFEISDDEGNTGDELPLISGIIRD